MMWLGRIALTIQSYPNRKPKLDRKNFNTAATLSWLIHQSGAEKGFTSYQKVLDTFVGPGDDEPHEEEEQQEAVYEDEGKRSLEEKLI